MLPETAPSAHAPVIEDQTPAGLDSSYATIDKLRNS